MKYAFEMGSVTEKLIKWDLQTHRQHGDLINLVLFQNKGSRLKIISHRTGNTQRFDFKDQLVKRNNRRLFGKSYETKNFKRCGTYL
jgi:hypothetical protein